MGYPAEHGAAQELAELKEVLAKQTAARIELHQAVASKDAAQLKTALEAAAEKLLEIEVAWAERELAALSGEVQADHFPSAEEILAEDEAKQRREEAEELAKSMQLDAVWQKVQAAIEVDDAKRLVEILQDNEGVLPAEKVQEAQKRLPAMWARAEMRRALGVAMKTPENLDQLKHMIAQAKRSCLPQAEVLKAEELLKEMIAQSQAAKAASRDGKEGRVSSNQAGNAPEQKKKVPQTKLELAVFANDKDAITSALAELKAEGKTVRETSHLYASARANFG
ncbi:Uncharacterized protein SCF082_LOCUS38030 [Durusdinium trenchii]|uniref:Uncharacterized protein n=1 Tax=Durusdinium trenchii TaxID=1381693 RepID=A0ABP0PUV5_9DINO